jgi:hypothetical protein
MAFVAYNVETAVGERLSPIFDTDAEGRQSPIEGVEVGPYWVRDWRGNDGKRGGSKRRKGQVRPHIDLIAQVEKPPQSVLKVSL